jgi:hypothetical protein
MAPSDVSRIAQGLTYWLRSKYWMSNLGHGRESKLTAP